MSVALPPNATPITGSGTGAASAITATLTAAATTITYLQGISVAGSGATAGSLVAITITGLLSGTVTVYYAVATGATLPNNPLVIVFATPLPASAINTSIVVNVPSFGVGNTAAGVTAWGFNN